MNNRHTLCKDVGRKVLLLFYLHIKASLGGWLADWLPETSHHFATFIACQLVEFP